MPSFRKTFLIVLYCFGNTGETLAQKDYAALVNPFIGTGGHGHTYPGASLPFGAMQLSPDTRMADWDGSSGYHYSDSVIYGFSHTHLSGTGIPDYCDLLFMPFTGEVSWEKEGYRSPFSHKTEKASPGYYEVLLQRQNIRARLTTSERSGMHEYGFPATAKDGAILIDLKHRDEVLESYIEKVSATELRGLRRSRSWAQNQYLYFYIRFEKPIRELAIMGDDGKVQNTSFQQGKNIKLFVRFALDDSKKVKAKVGLSAVSTEGARLNLDTEIRDWNFEAAKDGARAKWNKELAKIDIKGGTRDQQTIFYTALYHTFLAPNIFQDADGRYRGMDGKNYITGPGTHYSVFSLWDTYRAFNPLMTIINQKRTNAWVHTFLRQYQQGGMLPVWELAGNETFCMIGYHSAPVILDAYRKGIGNFDPYLALEAMQSYAESNRFGLAPYRENGFIGNDKEHESVSKTLEYAYDDWCIAQFAKLLGKDSVYRSYLQRAQSYKNLFDPSTGHMRGKVEAMWQQPFDPKEINNFFTEGNSWQYSFAVPQDISGLMALHGGADKFAAKLEELFTSSSITTGRDQADVTGLIGQYAHGNEPSHHMAYLFSYAGQPSRTQELVHKICTEFYRNAPDGLIGNEDCGQMSAWYVLSAMGFYPVCPGNGDYVLGTPLFDEVRLNLENGKQFIIRAKNKKNNAFYVSATKLNGKAHPYAYLEHSDIMKGGIFEFTLQEKANRKEIKKDYLPHTSIQDEWIVEVPFLEIKTYKFRDSLLVSMGHTDPDVKIYLTKEFLPVSVHDINNIKPEEYRGPIKIDSTCRIRFFAQKRQKKSATIQQNFYKVPSDKSITVLSTVHPMYTGGGADALIDGITGSENWRTGDWHSYYDTDFEAIIDLQKEREVTYAGVHVLQDVSPWILYPKEIIVYTSNDGKDFREAGRVSNAAGTALAPPEVKEIGLPLKGRYRYIKVRALSSGRLPSWHESAGNPSHLFIDEVIVK
jgi:predicted alpha-1,2-mannosidase